MITIFLDREEKKHKDKNDGKGNALKNIYPFAYSIIVVNIQSLDHSIENVVDYVLLLQSYVFLLTC